MGFNSGFKGLMYL